LLAIKVEALLVICPFKWLFCCGGGGLIKFTQKHCSTAHRHVFMYRLDVMRFELYNKW
jgi:hypothetical protein